MRAYLFDFDGTLVDSMPAYVGVMLRILDEASVPYDDSLVSRITPMGFVKTAEYFIEMGVKLTKEEILAKMNAYAVDEYTNRVPAKSNVIEVLGMLKARGDKLNVLTASPHSTLDPCLKRLGVFDMFENVWSCDDFGTTKADPEIYRMAAQRMGCRVEDVLFLDDNLNADKTAKCAGMQVCGVFDESSREYEAEIRAVSDFYINDFSELMNL